MTSVSAKQQQKIDSVDETIFLAITKNNTQTLNATNLFCVFLKLCCDGSLKTTAQSQCPIRYSLIISFERELKYYQNIIKVTDNVILFICLTI